MSAAIDYTPPPTVRRFMRSDARIRTIVGPIGSGKSSGCVLEIPHRAVLQTPNGGVRRTRGAVVRNTYRELEDTTRKTFEQWIDPGMGEWREKDFAFTFMGRLEDGTDVESEILFRSLDGADDVRKLLSLELTFLYFNEVRQIAKANFDAARGRIGRFPSMKDGGPSWYGLWGDSNAWHTGHWLHKLFKSEDGPPPGFELFEQPDALGPYAENLENLVPGYYTDQIHGRDETWINEYLRARYPSAVSGSVYGKLLSALRARNGIGKFDHRRDAVHASFDLGIADSTAIWWWRLSPGGGVDVLDHYEAHGEAASHYFRVLAQRGFEYAAIWLPHDARAHSFQTGKTTEEQFREHYGDRVRMTPQVDVADGIGAARWLLEQDATRFHVRCSEAHGDTDLDGLEALAAYRYDYDERNETMRRNPLHDWSSHTADAFRYVACAVKWAGLIRPVKPPPSVDPKRPATMNDLWKANRGSGNGWGRV